MSENCKESGTLLDKYVSRIGGWKFDQESQSYKYQGQVGAQLQDSLIDFEINPVQNELLYCMREGFFNACSLLSLPKPLEKTKDTPEPQLEDKDLEFNMVLHQEVTLSDPVCSIAYIHHLQAVFTSSRFGNKRVAKYKMNGSSEFEHVGFINDVIEEFTDNMITSELYGLLFLKDVKRIYENDRSLQFQNIYVLKIEDNATLDHSVVYTFKTSMGSSSFMAFYDKEGYFMFNEGNFEQTFSIYQKEFKGERLEKRNVVSKYGFSLKFQIKSENKLDFKLAVYDEKLKTLFLSCNYYKIYVYKNNWGEFKLESEIEGSELKRQLSGYSTTDQISDIEYTNYNRGYLFVKVMGRVDIYSSSGADSEGNTQYTLIQKLVGVNGNSITFNDEYSCLMVHSEKYRVSYLKLVEVESIKDEEPEQQKLEDGQTDIDTKNAQINKIGDEETSKEDQKLLDREPPSKNSIIIVSDRPSSKKLEFKIVKSVKYLKEKEIKNKQSFNSNNFSASGFILSPSKKELFVFHGSFFDREPQSYRMIVLIEENSSDYFSSFIDFDSLFTIKSEINMASLENVVYSIKKPSHADTNRVLASLPNKINLLYLLVLVGREDLIKILLQKVGYHEDKYSKDFHPIQEALDLNDYRVLKTFADYFDSNSGRIDVDSKILLQALACSSDVFKGVIISEFYRYNLQKNMPVSMRSPSDSLPIVLFRDDKQLPEKELEDLQASQQKYITLNKVEYLRTNFTINMHLGDPFIHKLLKKMRTNTSSVIEGDLSIITKSLWDTYAYIAFLQSFMYLLFTFCLFMTVIWFDDMERGLSFSQNSSISYSIGFFIFPILTLISYLLIFIQEIIVIVKNGIGNHFKNMYNFCDLLIYICFFPIMITVYSNPSSQTGKIINSLISGYLFLVGFRSLLQLRVIDSVRYLIAMVIRVFQDMIPFMVVLSFSIGLFSCLEVQIEKTILSDEDFQGGGHLKFLNFLKKIDLVYNVGYGNWDGTGEMPWNQYTLYFTESILFPLVMFNLLIAIISETFANFEADKEFINQRELIDILIDLSAIVSFFGVKGQKDEQYLHVFAAVNEGAVSNQELMDSVLEVVALKDEATQEKFEELRIFIKEGLSGLGENFRKEIQELRKASKQGEGNKIEDK